MIPIRDKNPSGIFPWVVYSIIAANVLVFLSEAALPEAELQRLVETFGLVPAKARDALKGEADLVGALVVPAFTCMFLHGGWLHLIGNMWFLHIFGDNVEGRIGHVRFIVFYLLCGLGAGALELALHPSSPVPTIGASGAIAGVLGAYIVCWPRARVLTLVPFFYVLTFIELPAFLVLGMWFIIQLFQGVGTIGARFATGGVAYWAHIGGFVAGLALIKMLPARKLPPAARRQRARDEARRPPSPRWRR